MQKNADNYAEMLNHETFPNEAGKTTIQQFILQIFFGFPLKNSALAKYEPKTGTRFGGQILFFHPKYGHCSIERVKGRAVGEVTILPQRM